MRRRRRVFRLGVMVGMFGAGMMLVYFVLGMTSVHGGRHARLLCLGFAPALLKSAGHDGPLLYRGPSAAA
ncbi:hypothetical protein UU7_16797, partial [Rhodanobacter spathiphylli B39]